VKVYFSKEVLLPIESKVEEFLTIMMTEKFLELVIAETETSPEYVG